MELPLSPSRALQASARLQLYGVCSRGNGPILMAARHDPLLSVVSSCHDRLMTLEYENTIDDIVAFQLYHFANSPTVKTKVRVQSVAIILVLGAAIVVGSVSWSDAVVPVTASALLGLLILQSKGLNLIARSHKTTFRKAVFGQGESAYGRRRLVLSEETLNEESSIEIHGFRYAAIGEIKDTPDFIFIYVNSVGAIVIPRRDQDPLVLESFIRELRQRISLERDGGSIAPHSNEGSR